MSEGSIKDKMSNKLAARQHAFATFEIFMFAVSVLFVFFYALLVFCPPFCRASSGYVNGMSGRKGQPRGADSGVTTNFKDIEI